MLLSGGDGEPAGPSDLAAGSGQTGPGTTDAPVALPAGVYEAEADDRSVRLRRAEVVQVAGVAGVQFTSRSGSIQFQSIQVPGDGQYLVTLVYAPGGAWSGSVRAGRAWEPIQFESGSGCCATVSVELPLSPRTNEIAIEPSRGDGPFPVIDHIIVEPRSA